MKTLFILIFSVLFLGIALFTDHLLSDDSDPPTEHQEEHHKESHDHDETPSNIGSGKAITAISHEEGFQLSEKAKEILGLKYLPVSFSLLDSPPGESLVYFQEHVGVYRLRKGWFKLIEVEKSVKSENSFSIRSPELEPGDQIVTKGTGLLRVADLDAFGGIEDGHGH